MTSPEIQWPRRSLGLRHVFLPVERTILTATHAALPAPAAHLFKIQIEQMQRGQRHFSWTEVLFYPQQPPNPTDPQWDDADLFPCRHQDLKIAKVVVKVSAQGHTTFVHVVSGHFFAITSRPGLKPIRRATPDTVSVALLADPMDPAAAPPLKLPRSYTSYVSKNGAGDHHGWDVLDPGDVYEVSLEHGAFLVLATRDGDTFLLTSAEGGGLFFCEHDDKPRRLKTTFERTLKAR